MDFGWFPIGGLERVAWVGVFILVSFFNCLVWFGFFFKCLVWFGFVFSCSLCLFMFVRALPCLLLVMLSLDVFCQQD